MAIKIVLTDEIIKLNPDNPSNYWSQRSDLNGRPAHYECVLAKSLILHNTS
jgi:hypothetical protein